METLLDGMLNGQASSSYQRLSNPGKHDRLSIPGDCLRVMRQQLSIEASAKQVAAQKAEKEVRDIISVVIKLGATSSDKERKEVAQSIVSFLTRAIHELPPSARGLRPCIPGSSPDYPLEQLTRAFVNKGIIPALVRLLPSSYSESIKEDIVLALAAVAVTGGPEIQRQIASTRLSTADSPSALKLLLPLLTGPSGQTRIKTVTCHLLSALALESDEIRSQIVEMNVTAYLSKLLHSNFKKMVEEATLCLRLLATGPDPCRAKIIDEGKAALITNLVRLLHMSQPSITSAATAASLDDNSPSAHSTHNDQNEERTIEHAAAAIGNLCSPSRSGEAFKSPEGIIRVRGLFGIEKGCLHSLFLLLESASSSDEQREQAAWAIRNIVRSHPENQSSVYSLPRALHHLTSILSNTIERRENSSLQDLVSGTLAELPLSPQEEEEIALSPGAISSLVSCAKTSHEGKMDSGSFRLLLKLLSSDSEEAHKAAAGVVSDLSSDPQYRQLFPESGALPPLVKMLGSKMDQAKVDGVKALMAISRDHPSNKKLVIAAGACLPLVGLIKPLSASGIGSHPEVQGFAAEALCLLSEDPEGKVKIVEAGAIPSLVSLLDPKSLLSSSSSSSSLGGGEALSVCAATILAELAFDDEAEDAIVAAGAIPFLVNMMKTEGSHSSIQAQEKAAWCLANLSAKHENMRAVIEGGAVDPAVALLSSPSLAVQEKAAWVLSNLSSEDKSPSIAIPLLCKIVANQASQPLPYHPSSDGSSLMEQVVRTLGHLAIHAEHREGICSLGVIRPLVDLLDKTIDHVPPEASASSKEGLQQAIVYCLWNCSMFNQCNQGLVHSAGGVRVLKRILKVSLKDFLIRDLAVNVLWLLGVETLGVHVGTEGLGSSEETSAVHGSVEVAVGRPGSGTKPRPGSATKRGRGEDGELLYKMIIGPDLV